MAHPPASHPGLRGIQGDALHALLEQTNALRHGARRHTGFSPLENEVLGGVHLVQERLIQAVRAIAACEAALCWTLDYTTGRAAFGGTLADFQNTQFKLAEIKAEIAVQRVFVDRCLELHLAGQLGPVDAAIAEMQTTELHGG